MTQFDLEPLITAMTEEILLNNHGSLLFESKTEALAAFTLAFGTIRYPDLTCSA